MALALARDASGPHGCLSAWPNATRRIRLFRSSICAAAAGACSGDTLVQFNGATFTGVGVVRNVVHHARPADTVRATVRHAEGSVRR